MYSENVLMLNPFYQNIFATAGLLLLLSTAYCSPKVRQFVREMRVLIKKALEKLKELNQSPLERKPKEEGITSLIFGCLYMYGMCIILIGGSLVTGYQMTKAPSGVPIKLLIVPLVSLTLINLAFLAGARLLKVQGDIQLDKLLKRIK